MALQDLGGGLVVDDDTGEVIEIPEGVDALTLLAHGRHDAKGQEDAWKQRRQAYDAALLAKMTEKRANFTGVVVSVMGRTYTKTDVDAFADSLAAAAIEWPDLMAVIAAAQGFKRDLLPESVWEIYDKHTEHLPTKAWIDSKPVLRRAS